MSHKCHWPDIVSELRRLHAEILASDEGRECEMMALIRHSADEIEHLRRQRDELLVVAKRYAAECKLCGGHSVRRRLDVDGVPLDDVQCEHCADVRLAIARAGGRSDG